VERRLAFWEDGASVDKWLIYRRVAQLHAEHIDQGFLSLLGPRFLALLYQAIDESPASTLILAREEDQVVGFVSGALGMGLIYRQLLRHGLRLMLALAPSLLMPNRLWRIIEILRYSQRGHDHGPKLPKAELLSIVVDPAFRGRQHADDLYRQLGDFFAGRGEPEFKIIVGVALAPAHRFYQRMGARPVAEIEVHQGVRSIVYVQSEDGNRGTEALRED
jgi:ribosomal protein S18 acetylase RimI-like enzyme